MRQVGANTFVELYFWGCNPSYVTTSDGAVLIDTPQQPIDALRWREQILGHGKPLRHLINTEPHPDHTWGNSYFPGVEVIAHVGIKERFDQFDPNSPQRIAQLATQDPDSVWLLANPDFPPNPPTRVFTDELTLQVGDHTFQCLHVPGHTTPQTAVFVPEEGVIFTGDNVFFHCKTFIQEGDPWEWLAALERIDQLDFEIIVPGHGETCDRSYLREQADIIRGWIDVVAGFVDRGMTEDEAAAQEVDVRKIDPYPIGQRLAPMDAWLSDINLRNTYRKMLARNEAVAPG